MTNGELEAYAKRQLPGLTQRIVDWRPASDMYIEDLVLISEYRGEMFAKFPNGILFDLKNGDHIIYIKHLTKEEQKYLKEHMSARVLTINEIHPEKVYWRQERRVELPFPVSFISDSDGLMMDYFGDTVVKAKYGEEWVLWNVKPTKAQMKAVKWKDDTGSGLVPTIGRKQDRW